MKPLTSTLSLLSVILFLNLSFQIGSSNSAKILSVEFFGSKSHVITYLPLLEELARKGHQVTLLSPSKGLTNGTNIKEIFTFNHLERTKDENTTLLFNPIQMKEDNVELNPFTFLTTVLPTECRKLYDRKDIQKVMEEDWDLILLQPMFNDCALGLVYKVNKKGAPLVLFTPTSAPTFVIDRIGGYHPVSFVSHQFLGYPDKMTFTERFINAGFSFVLDLIMSHYYLPAMETVYREKLGEDVPTAKEILGNASIVLSNGHFSLSRPKPNLPDVIDVGGIHSRAAKPLPKDFEDFIAKGGDNGFILFSLGSGILGTSMSNEKRQIFLNVFSKLKQQVIWKYEEENIPNLSKNVKLTKWMPQQDLLGHPKIQLFIYHCGLGGTEEAIYHAVPLIGMPFFGDQPLNAQEGENHGFLYKMDWNELSEDYLMKGINEVLNNSKYRENVQRLSKVFKDQIDDPLERGVWWMEYVLRHKGAPQLRSASRSLNYFQYHSLDVFAAYFLIILTVGYLAYFSLIKILQKVFSILGISTTKTSQDKKTN